MFQSFSFCMETPLTENIGKTGKQKKKKGILFAKRCVMQDIILLHCHVVQETVHPTMTNQLFLTLMIQSHMNFSSPQNTSGAPQQNSVAAFTFQIKSPSTSVVQVLQHSFIVKLQKCFVDNETSPSLSFNMEDVEMMTSCFV